jgi:hypothetical protein
VQAVRPKSLCCAVLCHYACSIIVGEVCSRSRWDVCYNNVWQMALAFGGCQLLLSQMPNLESAWWSSIIGATMSFMYSTCALGLGASKGQWCFWGGGCQGQWGLTGGGGGGNHAMLWGFKSCHNVGYVRLLQCVHSGLGAFKGE